MSELKTYKMVDKKYCTDCVCVIPSEVYLKSEADKVIADLEESHKKEVGQLLIEIAELKAQKAQAEDDCAYWKAKAKGEM
jgi:iron-sulfur cluster repair protein YtfE (RIC family)